MDDVLGLTVIRIEPLADFLSSQGIVVTAVDLAFFLYYAIAAVLVIIRTLTLPGHSNQEL